MTFYSDLVLFRTAPDIHFLLFGGCHADNQENGK
jgi:hypothetical protein